MNPECARCRMISAPAPDRLTSRTSPDSTKKIARGRAPLWQIVSPAVAATARAQNGNIEARGVESLSGSQTCSGCGRSIDFVGGANSDGRDDLPSDGE